MQTMRTSCTATRYRSVRPRSPRRATARTSAPASHGIISTGRSFTPNAPPPSARACCRTFCPYDAPMLLIPAIDLARGRCVRLYQGDFDAETRYSAEPLELLGKYRAYGAAWLHVVDLDGARDGGQGNSAIIQDLAAQESIRLQVGGGLRDRAAVARMLAAGAARC